MNGRLKHVLGRWDRLLNAGCDVLDECIQLGLVPLLGIHYRWGAGADRPPHPRPHRLGCECAGLAVVS